MVEQGQLTAEQRAALRYEFSLPHYHQHIVERGTMEQRCGADYDCSVLRLLVALDAAERRAAAAEIERDIAFAACEAIGGADAALREQVRTLRAALERITERPSGYGAPTEYGRGNESCATCEENAEDARAALAAHAVQVSPEGENSMELRHILAHLAEYFHPEAGVRFRVWEMAPDRGTLTVGGRFDVDINLETGEPVGSGVFVGDLPDADADRIAGSYGIELPLPDGEQMEVS